MLPRLEKIDIVHIVPFSRDDPARGLADALELFELAEELGLDGAWTRTRHLEYGLSSAALFLASAAQRTTRIELGTAVIPIVYESPLRLAEDLATADLLSGGRLHPGLSAAVSRHTGPTAERLFGPGWEQSAVKPYEQADRLLSFLRGEPVEEGGYQIGLSPVRELAAGRVEPHSPGLVSRLWWGAGSPDSTAWTARNDLGLLVSNIGRWEGSDVFEESQRLQIDWFRSIHPRGDAARVAKGLVIVPTDHATPERRARFEAYAEAREARTAGRQPGTGRIFERDFVGSTAEIVDRLLADVAVQAADELLFELPFQFDADDYRHIVHELATSIGPALGWTPRD